MLNGKVMKGRILLSSTLMLASLAAGSSLIATCDAFLLPPKNNTSRKPIKLELHPERCAIRTLRLCLYGSNDSDEEPITDENDKKEKPKSYTSRELYENEQKASKRTMDNLLLPGRLSDAVTALLYGAVILGVVLNLVGYDYYLKDGELVVDTLESRQFENEVRRAMKTQEYPET